MLAQGAEEPQDLGATCGQARRWWPSIAPGTRRGFWSRSANDKVEPLAAVLRTFLTVEGIPVNTINAPAVGDVGAEG